VTAGVAVAVAVDVAVGVLVGVFVGVLVGVFVGVNVGVGVGVNVAVDVAVAVAVFVAVAVGVATNTSSAPISYIPPWGRVSPSKSFVTAAIVVPVLNAGLPIVICKSLAGAANPGSAENEFGGAS
jgi:hypothetical protein